MTSINHDVEADPTERPPGVADQDAKTITEEESASLAASVSSGMATGPVPEAPAPAPPPAEDPSGERVAESQPAPEPDPSAVPPPVAETPPDPEPPAAFSAVAADIAETPPDPEPAVAPPAAGSATGVSAPVPAGPPPPEPEAPPATAGEPPSAGETYSSPEAASDAGVEDAPPVAAADPQPAIKARSVSSLPDDIGPEDFAAAIDETVLEFKDGDIIEGRVVSIAHDEVLVDIGYKSEGAVPLRELSIRKNVPPGEVVSLGQTIEVLVLEKEDEEGRLILSMKRAQYERAWGRIEKLRSEGGPVTGVVIEVVKGGLIVDIGLRGFLPASLVDLRRVRDLEQFVNEEIVAKVIELDRNRNNVVLSRRAYLEEEKAEQRTAFLDNLQIGEVREGHISSVVNFGAFVDLGGMDGLVHVSELSWQHVNHPSEVVKVGEKVTVKVLEIDRERTRISLSIKQTTEDPWQAFIASKEVGLILEGTVIKTVPFGAFVSVGHGVEGLVHVSEIAMHRVESPEMELSIGQKVSVKLTELDEGRRRASFSIKQALPNYSPSSRQSSPGEGPRPPRRHAAPPKVREFVSEEAGAGDQEEQKPMEVDASLEEILQELKERGIGR